MIRRFRHRIITAGMKRMTARDTPHSHPKATPWSPFIDRLEGIGRTARHIATVVAQEGADQQLIAAHQFEKNLFERHGAQDNALRGLPGQPANLTIFRRERIGPRSRQSVR